MVKTLMLGKDCPGRLCNSSFEAEARSLSEQDKENRATRRIIAGMGRPMEGPTETGVDSKGAAQMAYAREIRSLSTLRYRCSLFKIGGL
jgi:hypothetical protein